MTKHLSLILTTALAACGSTSSSAPTTPATPAEPAHDHADHDHAAAHQPDQPTAPATPEAAQVKAELLASERSAWDAAKPVFDKTCASCHTKAGKRAAKKKLDHFDLDSYPPGGH